MKKNILSFLLIFIQTAIFAQSMQKIRGTVQDADSGQPLIGVSLSISNGKAACKTDSNGVFTFDKLPVGRYSLQISVLGYEQILLTELLLESSKELNLNLKLKEQPTLLQETIVRGGRTRALSSVNKITMEQVMRFPATFQDPARLAMSYAGVANTNDQANAMVIRGNSPNGLQWRLEGVEIVNPNHLSNAGTFSDRATQNAGGTNILSAQLLGEMDFMTGAFPSEYGNALSGVMDMRLRRGNNQKNEYTVQMGLIGLDLAAEGPLKKNGASFLVNYRYSFTGLLGLLGVNFGGESIKYQDLAFNLTFPTKRAGTFTVFGMGGNSSNIYAGIRDFTKWTSQKDGFDIDFGNKMAATGITHEKTLGSRTNWRTVLAFSGLESKRNGYILDQISYNRFAFDVDSLSKRKYSFSSSLSHKISSALTVKEGLFITYQQDEIYSRSFGFFSNGSVKSVITQPFVNAQFSFNKLTANVGIHYLNYSYNQSSSLEPRASVSYQFAANQSLTAAYGLHSQMQAPQVYFSKLENPLENNNRLGLSKAQHFVIGHELKLKKNAYFKTELYYQKLFNIPIIAKSAFIYDRTSPTFSALNLVESFVTAKLENAGTGTNYGIEMTFEKYLSKGFYGLVTGSLYNASYTDRTGTSYNARFNGRHTFNATIGKEFANKKGKILGVNLRTVWLGGFWDTPINMDASRRGFGTVYETTNPFSIKQKDYFRPDLRLYFKRNRNHYTRTFSMDLQNFIGYQNEAYSYYDILLRKVVKQYQLGLIPMLSYRVEF